VHPPREQKLGSVFTLPPVIAKAAPGKESISATPKSGPIEAPVGRLDQGRFWIDALRTDPRRGPEIIYGGQGSAWGDLEDRTQGAFGLPPR
jgi:hypothetical protein